MIDFEIVDTTIKISFNKQELDLSDARQLELIVSSIQKEFYKEIILDFNGVKFMNSTTMGQIAKLMQDAKNKNATIFSKGKIDPFVFQLFSISGLEDFILNSKQ